MTGSPPEDLAHAAHRNLVGYQARAMEWFPGGRAERRAGLLLASAALTFPAFHLAVREEDGCPAAPAVEAAVAGLRGHGDGFTLFIRPGVDDDLAAAAAARGAREFGAGPPEMVCPRRLPDVPVPAGGTIRRVDDAAGVAAYASIAGRAFATMGWPGDQITRSFADADALLRDDVWMFLGAADGEPVAAAMCVVLPARGAYISWVATLEEARRRGLGEAVTRAATNAGFDAGAGFASLEASPMGAPVYERMGYETLYRYRVLVWLNGSRA